MADAIVEITETGSSLKANNLKIIDTLLESTTVLIANKKSWKDKFQRTKIENLVTMLQGALRAGLMVGLKMNVQTKDLDKVLAILPSMKNPTVSALAKGDWVAVETIIDETEARELFPALKRAGAEGLVEYPLNKVIP